MGHLACLQCSSDKYAEKAQALASFLQIPINPSETENFNFRLVLDDEGLRLHDREGRTLEIDFVKDHLNYQRRGLRGKNELLAKALGHSKGVRKILDLSAGMGIDAVFMTQIGFKVTAIERSQLLYALLNEALTNAGEELQSKLSFVWSDSIEYLTNPQSSRDFDAIYFDPMYPHKKKTALPKQEMVVFRELVGHDEDAAKVLEAAMNWPVSRVVVKRPVGAEPLAPGVRHSYEGKVVRYDVYMRSV